MGLITIDEQKCKKDGICAAECPLPLSGFKRKTAIRISSPGVKSSVYGAGIVWQYVPMAPSVISILRSRHARP